MGKLLISFRVVMAKWLLVRWVVVCCRCWSCSKLFMTILLRQKNIPNFENCFIKLNAYYGFFQTATHSA